MNLSKARRVVSEALVNLLDEIDGGTMRVHEEDPKENHCICGKNWPCRMSSGQIGEYIDYYTDIVLSQLGPFEDTALSSS